MDGRQRVEATSASAIAGSMNVAAGTVVKDDGLNIKQELGDSIGLAVLQHMDSHYRTNQPCSLVKQERLAKQESPINNMNINPILGGEVKMGIIEAEQRDTDGQRSLQATATPAIDGSMNADASSAVQDAGLELGDKHFDVGSTVDSRYRTKQRSWTHATQDSALTTVRDELKPGPGTSAAADSSSEKDFLAYDDDDTDEEEDSEWDDDTDEEEHFESRNNAMMRAKEKKWSKLTPIIHKMNSNFVSLNAQEKGRNSAILNTIFTILINKMRKVSPLLASLKPHFYYRGSYFEGMRVGTPTEYDIQVTLKFPINYDDIKVIGLNNSEFTDYVEIIMTKEYHLLSKHPTFALMGYDITQYWCDSQYRLSQESVRNWFQSVLDKTLNTFSKTETNEFILGSKNGSMFYISYTTSCPAFTIKIASNLLADPIDIDLVPILSFHLPKWPLNSKIDKSAFEKTGRLDWNAIPKPLKSQNIPESIRKSSWRLDFSQQEKILLHDMYHLKNVVRLLKKFRDVQKFDGLVSYHIKTIFLLELEDHPRSFWKTNISVLLVFMLTKLQEYISNGNIPYYWCRSENLFQSKQLKEATLKNWAQRISYILKDIHVCLSNNPVKIAEYFLEPEEYKSFQKIVKPFI